MRDLTDEESKIYNDRLESEAIDTAIMILDNLRPSCGPNRIYGRRECRHKTEAIVQTLKEGDVGDDTCRTTQNKEE